MRDRDSVFVRNRSGRLLPASSPSLYARVTTAAAGRDYRELAEFAHA
jgi:hypothetical protein